MQAICAHLKKEPSSFIFQKPVDNNAFPNYRRVIAQPMDLSTLSRRVDSNYYSDYFTFHNDLLRLFRNGCTFNACCDIWYQQCVVLKLVYMQLFASLQRSGLLARLQPTSPSSQVVAVKRDGDSLSGFSEGSSEWLHVIAKEDATERFMTRYEGGEGSFGLLKYRLLEATEEFEASEDDDEMSCSA